MFYSGVCEKNACQLESNSANAPPAPPYINVDLFGLSATELQKKRLKLYTRSKMNLATLRSGARGCTMIKSTSHTDKRFFRRHR